ncbi:MAG: ATP-dependent DNA helicase RecG [Deltaproteobacteria bacterium]|nr:ATP-dependent DNA helicase RecG [Deltaproteobacteria bacterium]
MELTRLRGVGPKIADRLREAGIESAEQLLAIFPRRYLDRAGNVPIDSLDHEMDATVKGTVVSAKLVYRRRPAPPFATVMVEDDTGAVRVTFFGAQAKGTPHAFRHGRKVLLSGVVRSVNKVLTFQHPHFEFLDDEDAPLAPLPVYPLFAGFGPKRVAGLVGAALDQLGHRLMDALEELTPPPSDDWMALGAALQTIHQPDTSLTLEALNAGDTPAHRRMIFDELFFMQLGLHVRRRGVEAVPGLPISVTGKMRDAFEASLGFALTKGQRAVLDEIRRDLTGGPPMHRLLQGDVGSGKTAVAFLAAADVIESGYQVALMAPTELLAVQHYQRLAPLCEAAGIKAMLLTGQMSAAHRRRALDRIVTGNAKLVIGTHSLISDKVEFARLGMAIVDEQHRFGVGQRAALRRKEDAPHLLVMSATPIPRSLAMTLYGDLDLSLLTERPPGRRTVETRLIVGNEDAAYRLVRERVEAGGRAFLVYPLVEESEELDLDAAEPMAEKFAKEHFADFGVGLVHGRMGSDERDRVMDEFRRGEIRVLVGTTVVEVGVDVPEATVILIAHAERFGLSQLHQLRGRVGRSDAAALCVLLASGEIGDKAYRRLDTLVRTDDGLQIAEEDLAIRGPGDILGRRQHGLPAMRWASLARDMALLESARDAARRLLDEDPALAAHPKIARVLKHRWGDRLDLGGSG